MTSLSSKRGVSQLLLLLTKQGLKRLISMRAEITDAARNMDIDHVFHLERCSSERPERVQLKFG